MFSKSYKSSKTFKTSGRPTRYITGDHINVVRHVGHVLGGEGVITDEVQLSFDHSFVDLMIAHSREL